MAEDAIKIAPHAYKVVLDNDRVRVLESRMKPGDKTEMHGHPAVVACAVIGGKFKFTLYTMKRCMMRCFRCLRLLFSSRRSDALVEYCEMFKHYGYWKQAMQQMGIDDSEVK